MTDDARHADGTDRCDSCGASRESEPLRSIRMTGGDRELLCEACFGEARADNRVSSLDPRLPGENE